MATTATVIPVEEYLAARYDGPTPEYLDGHLVERSVPNSEHSRFQWRTCSAVERACPRLRCGSELHVKVGQRRYRVLDVAAYLDEMPPGIPDTPPLINIELLSPDDAFANIVDRFEALRAFGIRYLWLIDPVRKTFHVLGRHGLVEVDSFQIPELQFHLTADDIFA